MTEPHAVTKLKVMTILGTRPEIIRLARVIDRLDAYCDHVIVHTGQNWDYELNDVFFDPYGRVEGHFTDNTLSVHLYTNGTKPWWRKNVPLANSYAARMCAIEGVDPAQALEE